MTRLGSTLQTTKFALSKLHTDIQDDNAELQASITFKLDKLQEALAVKNSLMDKLTMKTEKIKVLSVKLSHATHHIDELQSEKFVIKICVGDVHQYLLNLIET